MCYMYSFCSLVDEKDELSILKGEGVFVILDDVSLQRSDLLRNNLKNKNNVMSLGGYVYVNTEGLTSLLSNCCTCMYGNSPPSGSTNEIQALITSVQCTCTRESTKLQDS